MRKSSASLPRRGRVTAVAALLLALVMIGHQYVPDVFTLGTIVDSILPWLGLLIVPLLLVAALRRAPLALAATIVPMLVWAVMFGPALVQGPAGGPSNLTVAEQNLYAYNDQPQSIVTALAGSGAEVIGLVEVTDKTAGLLQTELGPHYPYVLHVSTLEIWSKYPIGAWTSVDIGLDWTRALHTSVDTPSGTVSVYLAHLDSFRFDSDTARNIGLSNLGSDVKSDPSKRILLMGDLNTADTDRRFSDLSPLVDAQQYGAGLGFSYPTQLPYTRPDHIMVEGIRVTDAWTIAGPGSDHRGTEATLDVT